MRKSIFVSISLLTCMVLQAQNPFLPYATTATDSIKLLLDVENDYRYGYKNFCTTNEQKLYRLSIKAFTEFTANANAQNKWIEHHAFLYPAQESITDPGIFAYSDLMCRVYSDVPELYALSSYIPRYTDDYSGYYLRVSKLTTPSQYAREMAEIDSVVGGVLAKITPSMSRYEQLLYLHDTLCAQTQYGGMSYAWAGTIEGTFLKKKAVCEGWSRGFLYLCQKAGFNCLYIGGGMITKTTPDTIYGNHAWNFVELDGQWYLVDATTDGGLIGASTSHRAFLKGKTYFDANYRIETAQWDGSLKNENLTAYPTLPTLATDDYNPNKVTTPIPSVVNEDSPHSQNTPSTSVQKVLKNGAVYIIRSNAEKDCYYTPLGIPLTSAY